MKTHNVLDGLILMLDWEFALQEVLELLGCRTERWCSRTADC